MQYYYFNLPKDNDLTFEKNKMVSNAIMQTARRAFEPFEIYLNNAIKALEKKENIKAKWKKINVENAAELKIIGGLFEVPKKTIVRFEDSALEHLQVGDIINGSAGQHRIISIEKDEVVFDVVPDPDELLFWNKKLLNFSIYHSEKPNGIIIREEPHRYIIYSEKIINNFFRIPDRKLSSFIDFENLALENGNKLSFQRYDGLSITLSDSNDFGKKVISNQIKFAIERTGKNSKDAFWIQLMELEENGDDDVPGFSPLRYFFDDDVEVYSELDKEEIDKRNRTKYTVASGNESEFKIVLQKKVPKEILKNGKEVIIYINQPCYPPENYDLQVKVNTYNLKKQLEAISTLLQMPVSEQAKLIKLFEKRDLVKWPNPDNNKINDWIVITDEIRSGCSEQREFVNKALNVPNFAFLEGPPGSGKTTVILELICQLARQGKRVLLCGSTHIAIDNVLDRLKEPRNGTNLLEQFNILPVRIGDENRINEDIREFQINNLIEENGIDQTLLLEASNLVCGTTIGILQHPKFKKRGETYFENERKMIKAWSEPVIPEFDYLVIDESSKTTFQEFLVPALYARKWILVGDVMQLSPFTEREEIVSNIEQISIDGKQLPYELQQAVFFLHKLKGIILSKNNRFVFPVEKEVMYHLLNELIYGRTIDFKGKSICLLVEEKIKEVSNDILIKKSIHSVVPLELVCYDIIFIEKHLLESNLLELPETHAILRSTKWKETEHAFIHNVYQQQHQFEYKERIKEMTDSFEITAHLNNYFYEKNWAEEIAWRVDREHQVRMAQKNKIKDGYGKVIDELMPKSIPKEKIESKINLIASIAFPSILESLVNGISGRKQRIESTISEGFKPDDLEPRRTMLKYQHRMHPDISKFPRQQFYQEKNALLDLEKPMHIQELRKWNYAKYQNRSVWIDVQGKTVFNYNNQEVEVLIRHLKDFIGFASKNPQPEGKEWTVACLTFYKGQEKRIREKLQQLTSNENGFSNFNIINGKYKINIKLHTVDKFQGHEADIVFLSMVQTVKDGFMDNPNRLNVAITRAKFQLVILGCYDYFLNKSYSDDLRELAKNSYKQ